MKFKKVLTIMLTATIALTTAACNNSDAVQNSTGTSTTSTISSTASSSKNTTTTTTSSEPDPDSIIRPEVKAKMDKIAANENSYYDLIEKYGDFSNVAPADVPKVDKEIEAAIAGLDENKVLMAELHDMALAGDLTSAEMLYQIEINDALDKRAKALG